ncbi:hypothetical protein PS903_02622 [Pseudomonas fluorescens]|nr:hypothetical protein PS903_02622 [Pseudomonas fluorescens]
MKKLLAVLALPLSVITPAFSSPPSTFSEAKVIAKQKIYLDQANSAMGELYCGCKWTWVLSPPNLIGHHRPKRGDQEGVLPGRLLSSELSRLRDCHE